MMTFYLSMLGIFAVNTTLLAFLTWAHRSPRFAKFRISNKPGMKVSPAERIRTMIVISVLSTAMVFGGIYGLGAHLLYDSATTPIWRIAIESLAVLTIYDFLYYWLHRAMHNKKAMRYVHGVHHKARNPTVLESFFLHPVELAAGLGLLFLCTLLVGPVHQNTFLVVFFVYSNLNITVHAGLAFPNLLLRPLSFMTRKHHIHHQDNFTKNYASLTNLPDLLFGTAT